VKETLHFKVSSGLKNILGKELITNQIVAIFELVKNSFDANAKKVEIVFDMQQGIIEITDNGHGMSYDDIKEKWLFVAYSEKKDSTKQTFAGSKGIGRLSCDRLGKSLTLITKKKGITSKLDINWENFEGDDKRKFEDLQVFYEKISDDFIDSSSGTKLILSGLRDDWNKKNIEKVNKSLEKLINPFKEDDAFGISMQYIDDNGEREDSIKIENTILNLLDDKTTFLHCHIKDNRIIVNLQDRKNTIYNIEIENTTILKNTEFKVYFLNRAAKLNFTRRMGIEPINYGSIFLYKNGFRVFPFGEIDYDAFGLNLRKTQGYNRYLGQRDLLGWIDIQDQYNHFQEVSSRDKGFIENIYTIELERIYFDLVQRPLETYMQLIKFGDIDIEEQDKDIFQDQFDKLLNRYKKYNILKLQKYELPKIIQPIEAKIDMLKNEQIREDDKEAILDSIKENAKNFEAEVTQIKRDLKKEHRLNEKLSKEVALKNKVISEKKPGREEFLEHELSKASDSIVMSLGFMMDELDSNTKKKVLENSLDIIKTCKKLKEIQKVILRVDFDTKVSKNKLNLIYYIQSYIDSLVTNKRIAINIKYQEKNDALYVMEVNIFDIGLIIDNLISNAIDLSAKQMDIIFNLDGKISIITDTPAIEVEPITKIFDYGFTTKEDGYGIGLYIVKESVEQLGWQITVNNKGDNLVEFNIDTNRTEVKEDEEKN